MLRSRAIQKQFLEGFGLLGAELCVLLSLVLVELRITNREVGPGSVSTMQLLKDCVYVEMVFAFILYFGLFNVDFWARKSTSSFIIPHIKIFVRHSRE